MQGLGTISANLLPFLLPVIGYSTNLEEASSVYLLEDGLELWLNLLYNAKTPTPEILQLATNIGPILSESYVFNADVTMT